MSRSNKPDKWSSRGRRGLDVLLMTCLGLFFCVLFHKPLDVLATLLGENLAYWSRWIQYTTVATLSGVLWWFLIHLGGFRSKDLWKINTLCYPPTWLGGVSGGRTLPGTQTAILHIDYGPSISFDWFDSGFSWRAFRVLSSLKVFYPYHLTSSTKEHKKTMRLI